MRGFRGLVLGIAMSIGAIAGARCPGRRNRILAICLRQPAFRAMNQLIKKFEAANPDITVKQTTFPYADYQTRDRRRQGPCRPGSGRRPALSTAGLDQFVNGGQVDPAARSGDVFPHAEIEKPTSTRSFRTMKRGGDYYGLPTAVRSLALFYNKALLDEAGLDPNKPPNTLDEYARGRQEATTKRDGSRQHAPLPASRDRHAWPGSLHWWREVLLRQNGGVPYDADRQDRRL
jgi:multiple sugar transport system substrate-binding protein